MKVRPRLLLIGQLPRLNLFTPRPSNELAQQLRALHGWLPKRLSIEVIMMAQQSLSSAALTAAPPLALRSLLQVLPVWLPTALACGSPLAALSQGPRRMPLDRLSSTK